MSIRLGNKLKLSVSESVVDINMYCLWNDKFLHTTNVFYRRTVSQSHLSQPPLGFIVSSLARRGKTWPKSHNKCQRYEFINVDSYINIEFEKLLERVAQERYIHIFHTADTKYIEKTFDKMFTPKE